MPQRGAARDALGLGRSFITLILLVYCLYLFSFVFQDKHHTRFYMIIVINYCMCSKLLHGVAETQTNFNSSSTSQTLVSVCVNTPGFKHLHSKQWQMQRHSRRWLCWNFKVELTQSGYFVVAAVLVWDTRKRHQMYPLICTLPVPENK
jgi:hypothetical protein